MKRKILVFKDGIAVEPGPGVRERWLVKRNKRGAMWYLEDHGDFWTLHRCSLLGGTYTTPLMTKTLYEVENVNDRVDNWKYYK